MVLGEEFEDIDRCGNGFCFAAAGRGGQAQIGEEHHGELFGGGGTGEPSAVGIVGSHGGVVSILTSPGLRALDVSGLVFGPEHGVDTSLLWSTWSLKR